MMGLTRSLHTGYVLASCPHFFSIVLYSAHFIFLPKPVSLFMITWPNTEGKKCFICQHFTLQSRAQQAINNVINTVNEKKKVQSCPFISEISTWFFFLLSSSQILSWNASAVFYFESLHGIGNVQNNEQQKNVVPCDIFVTNTSRNSTFSLFVMLIFTHGCFVEPSHPQSNTISGEQCSVCARSRDDASILHRYLLIFLQIQY